MSNRRAEVQQQMVMVQIREVGRLIQQLRDAMDVSEMCDSPVVVISRPMAWKAARNLEDMMKRFLVGQI